VVLRRGLVDYLTLLEIHLWTIPEIIEIAHRPASDEADRLVLEGTMLQAH
jgi:hypothetical protein